MIGTQRGFRPGLSCEIIKPLTRVELHVHLDGALRHETIYELSKFKNLPLPGDGSFQALQQRLIVNKGVSLCDYLSGFDLMWNSMRGDLKALERVAYEHVEDTSKDGIAYSEVRFSPHGLMPEPLRFEPEPSAESKDWVWNITAAVIKGLKRGQTDFGTKCSIIVSCLRGKPDFWFDDSIELVKDFNFHGGWLVGIDISGVPEPYSEEAMLTKATTKFYQDAVRLGIPRTIHAGESGNVDQVTKALDDLHAMRIGHGYRIASDKNVYERIRREQIHLECCPWSSILTGSVDPACRPHPIVQFFQDDFNVSLSRDDPTVTGATMDDNFNLVREWGLTEAHIIKATFDAARSSFLPENEKADLLQDLSKKFGCLPRNVVPSRT